MSRTLNVAVITNMPVHHQVDLFDTIHRQGEVALKVYYLRAMSAGRLWTAPSFLNHPHCYLPEVRIKDHWYLNRGVLGLLTELRYFDLVVVCQYASVTMQAAMHQLSFLRRNWVFWSEPISGVRYAESPLLRSELLRAIFRHIALSPIRYWPSQCWATGKMAVESFKEALPHPRLEVMPYYSDLSPFFGVKYGSDNAHRFAFLFSGSLSYRKGFDLLVDAVDRLAQQGVHQFVVRVLGKGHLGETIPSSLRDYFDLRGFVQRAELPNHFALADVLVFPSRYDGWGMALVEALASGIPVVAGPCVGAAVDIIRQGENGWILDMPEAGELADRMAWCLCNREALNDMSKAARKSAVNYHVEAGAIRFAELVKQAVG